MKMNSALSLSALSKGKLFLLLISSLCLWISMMWDDQDVSANPESSSEIASNQSPNARKLLWNSVAVNHQNLDQIHVDSFYANGDPFRRNQALLRQGYDSFGQRNDVFSHDYPKYFFPAPSSSFSEYNRYYDDRKKFWRRPSVMCTYEPDDAIFFNNPSNERRHSSYIVINEPRSGSSWLQEISQMHPGIKVQFELDLYYGQDALQCKQCRRPHNPDTKFPSRLPPKLHPPQACGMTIFGSSNKFTEVGKLAEQQNASLVILVRKNHVAHAVSAYRHFQKLPKYASRHDLMVPWDFKLLEKNVLERRAAYDKLLEFPSQTKRRAHFVFYEDMKRHPQEVWTEIQTFLGIPVHNVGDITELELKSTSKPSIDYLTNLDVIKASAQGSDWHDMVSNPNYDDNLDVGAEFARICSLHTGADISWRLHSCQQGIVVPRA